MGRTRGRFDWGPTLRNADQESRFLIAKAARDLFRSVEDLPALPPVLARLPEYLHDAQACSQRVADEIALDPKIEADLLRTVNGPTIGLDRPIENVAEAVSCLGVNRSISLALANAVMELQRGIGRGIPEADRTWINQRMVMIAAAAEAFAREFTDVSPDAAHLLGLFQDLGLLVFANVYGMHYSNLLQRFRSIGHLRLEAVEFEEFGTSHSHVSAAMLQSWGMPAPMIHLTLVHPDPVHSGDRTEAEQAFLKAMQLGEAFANLADGHAARRWAAFNKMFVGFWPGEPTRCHKCLQQAVEKTAEFGNLFTIGLPDLKSVEDLVERISRGEAPTLAGERSDPGASEATERVSAENGIDFGGGECEKTDRGAVEGRERSRRRPIVLAIDDDPVVLEVISGILAAKDIDVRVGLCIDAAYEHLSQADVLLLDIHMPGGNGIEIARDFRSRGFDRPIILVSGDGQIDTVREGIAAGVTDYLLKPISKDLLLRKLRRHIPWNDTLRS